MKPIYRCSALALMVAVGALGGQAAAEPGPDEIAGLRARFDQAAAFQQVIGLGHGDRADAMAAAGLADRRQAVAGSQHAVGDQLFRLLGKILITAHGRMVAGPAGAKFGPDHFPGISFGKRAARCRSANAVVPGRAAGPRNER